MKNKQPLLPETYRSRMNRADERILLALVMAFQILSLGLLAFKAEKVCTFSLWAAVLLPLGTYISYRVIIRFFHADRMLFILTAFLCSLSIVLLRAVFEKSINAEKQMRLLITVLPVLLVGMWIPRHFTGDEKLIGFAAVAAIPFMLVPLFLSTSSSARSWINFGFFQLQPSEIIKPVMIVVLASGFKVRKDWFRILLYGVLSLTMMAILYFQRDLGALFLYFIITYVLFTAGTGKVGWSLLLLVTAVAGAAGFVAYSNATGEFGYLQVRIAIWRNPWSDEYNSSRQIAQGLMSIASGGLFGSGLGLSAAVRVAVVESDYIFAASAEELGSVFSICVLCVYALILLKGIQIALNARNRFHALVALGVVVQLTSQALLIVLGNLNVIPLTGVTLPFVSSGGSSLIGSCLQMGMLMGVSSINAEDEYDDLMRLSKGRWKEESA